MGQNRRGPGRPKSPRRRYTERGNESGVAITPRDKARLVMLERWHTLSAAHVARTELDPAHWSNGPSAAYASRIRGVRRRFNALANVERSDNNRTGPLVGFMLHGDDGFATYWTTKFGGTAARMPWPGRSGIVWHSVNHHWLAADIGLQLESAGYRVASEREIVSGVTHDHIALPYRFESRAPTGNIEPTKTPDLAVLGDRGDYIAVMVITDPLPKPAALAETMRAFRTNTAVQRLWVVATSETAARRVATAAKRADVENIARIRLANRLDARRWALSFDQDLNGDLRLLRPFQTPEAAQTA